MVPKKRWKPKGSHKAAASRQSVRPLRLPHWRADGNPKVRYPSETEANKAAFAFRLEHGTDLNVYQCEYCGGWHMGTSDDDR
jgi:hypothetical protein